MILDIHTTDTPGNVLRVPAKPAEPSVETSMLLHSMIETLRAQPEERGAVGLAAPQVGVSVRAIVFGTEKQGWAAMLNPRVIRRSGVPQTNVEACLSMPGVSRKKRRPASVTVEGQDAEGHYVKMNAKGLAAAALCHEIDHTNGILI